MYRGCSVSVYIVCSSIFAFLPVNYRKALPTLSYELNNFYMPITRILPCDKKTLPSMSVMKGLGGRGRGHEDCKPMVRSSHMRTAVRSYTPVSSLYTCVHPSTSLYTNEISCLC